MSLSVLSTPGSPSRSPSRIPEVDGLRGLAIVLVMLWHYVAIVVEPPRHSVAAYAVSSLRLAWSGVDLFFVLSGFLIGGILIDERTSPRYLANFYRRRFFRIVPLYALVCGLFWAAVLLGGAKRYGVAGHWLFGDPLPWYSFPLFVQNAFIAIRGTFDPMPTGVTWSLAIEEQFYLTLPLLVRHLSRRRLVQVLATAALAAPVL
ncbi:MAG TPA: acyltransferase, partial [Polyangiaceae bacterium]|nr:acyltransferase [Polyangiaceae bacterium]